MVICTLLAAFSFWAFKKATLVVRDGAMFEVSFSNWAWIYHCHGLFIEADGTLWSYTYSPEKPQPHAEHGQKHTLAELRARHADAPQRRKVGRLTPAEMAGLRSLSAEALKAPMGSPVHVSCDAGSSIFYCHVPDAPSPAKAGAELWHTHILAVQGDMSNCRTSPAASALFTKLRDLAQSTR